MLEVVHKAYAPVYSLLVCRQPYIRQTATYEKHRILRGKACTRLSRCTAKRTGDDSEVYDPIWCQNYAANLFDRLLLFGGAQRTVSGRVDGHYGADERSAHGFLDERRATKNKRCRICKRSRQHPPCLL